MAQEMVKNYQKKGKEITLERAVQLAKQALEDEEYD
jgi:hypothetical protein